jgi:hypothetical protein
MEKTMSDTITIPRKVLASLISQVIGGYPNPDDSTPPGPWDPYIRKAIDRIKGPHPIHWIVAGPVPNPWIVAGPGPQPWRLAYTTVLAQEVVSSITNLQDIAGILEGAQTRVQEVARQRLQVFIDDYCGTPPRKNPFPWPRPRDEINDGFSPLELVVIGTQFETAATWANEDLKQAFLAASAQLIDQGIAKM